MVQEDIFIGMALLILREWDIKTLKKTEVPIICNYASIQSGDCSLSMLTDSRY